MRTVRRKSVCQLVENGGKLPVLAAILGGVVLAGSFSSGLQADAPLGTFTLTNYYTPTSPTNSTLTDPSNPLSATITFNYLSSNSNGNLGITISNTSTPVSNNEMIRDVVFQISDGGQLLSGSPINSTAYLANDVYEYNNGSESPVFAGGTLTAPWAIQLSSNYSNSYDLTSTKASVANLDLVGPSTFADYGSAGTSINDAGFTPCLMGPVTFDVNIPNLDSSAFIQNISIGYGLIGSGSLGLDGGYAEILSSVPAPEPGAAALLALCAGALLLKRRRPQG